MLRRIRAHDGLYRTISGMERFPSLSSCETLHSQSIYIVYHAKECVRSYVCVCVCVEFNPSSYFIFTKTVAPHHTLYSIHTFQAPYQPIRGAQSKHPSHRAPPPPPNRPLSLFKYICPNQGSDNDGCIDSCICIWKHQSCFLLLHRRLSFFQGSNTHTRTYT